MPRLVCVLLSLVLVSITSCSSALSDRRGIEKGTIRIGTYNVKDFFDDFDDPGTADGAPPSRERLLALADVIKIIDCDILALQEVENLTVLENFNKDYLGGQYRDIFLTDGFDPRGIDSAVMSRFELQQTLSFETEFPRKLIAVTWTNPLGEKWTLLNAHLKSGGTGTDSSRRTDQVNSIVDICRGEDWIDGWFRGIVILAGDLNAEPGSTELGALNSVPFSDPERDLEVRFTHRSGKALDHILLSPDADRRYIIGSVTIYRAPPASEASDHYPMYLDLRY